MVLSSGPPDENTLPGHAMLFSGNRFPDYVNIFFFRMLLHENILGNVGQIIRMFLHLDLINSSAFFEDQAHSLLPNTIPCIPEAISRNVPDHIQDCCLHVRQ